MTFECHKPRGFRTADADVLVEKENARAQRSVEQPAAYVLEVRTNPRRRGHVEKKVDGVIGLAHALFDHGQVRMEDTHAHLNVLVNVTRKVALGIVAK